MDISELAVYPFTKEAAAYVEKLNIDINNFFSHIAYERVRERGKERILQAIEGAIIKPEIATVPQAEIELLSYPLARIMVSCIKDTYLIRRYSLAEAKSAGMRLEKQDEVFLEKVGREFFSEISLDSSGFMIHFTDYIRYASSMKELKWKLVNRKLKNGWVYVMKEDFARLMQEVIRRKIEDSFPLAVPEGAEKKLARYINEIKLSLNNKKSEFNINEFKEIKPDLFPPCIRQSIAAAQSGINLAHSARFALVSFLLNTGMTVEKILELFKRSPDFDEDKTRYQVQHIAGSGGTVYTPPSCATMATYGNCIGKDELCRRVSHPLSYYRKKMSKSQ